MGNVLFFIKTLACSLVVVMILQIHIGGRTLEQRTVALAGNSVLLAPIEGVVEAAAVSIHRGWDSLTNHIKSRAFRPGSRESQLKMERHPDVIKKAEGEGSI